MVRANPTSDSDNHPSEGQRPSERALALAQHLNDRYIEDLLGPRSMLQVFGRAHLEPPREWLLEWGRMYWGMKWDDSWRMEDAILYFKRAGATEELNGIGEFLALDQHPWAISAFLAARNRTRAREVGEAYLRAGHLSGMRAFRALRVRPSEDLLRAFAAAAFAAKVIAIDVLTALEDAGIVLPRVQLREAAKSYDAKGDWYSARVIRERLKTRAPAVHPKKTR